MRQHPVGAESLCLCTMNQHRSHPHGVVVVVVVAAHGRAGRPWLSAGMQQVAAHGQAEDLGQVGLVAAGQPPQPASCSDDPVQRSSDSDTSGAVDLDAAALGALAKLAAARCARMHMQPVCSLPQKAGEETCLRRHCTNHARNRCRGGHSVHSDGDDGEDADSTSSGIMSFGPEDSALVAESWLHAAKHAAMAGHEDDGDDCEERHTSDEGARVVQEPKEVVHSQHAAHGNGQAGPATLRAASPGGDGRQRQRRQRAQTRSAQVVERLKGAVAAHKPTTGKRLGQRARRALHERMYGADARHLKVGHAAVARGTSYIVWHVSLPATAARVECLFSLLLAGTSNNGGQEQKGRHNNRACHRAGGGCGGDASVLGC